MVAKTSTARSLCYGDAGMPVSGYSLLSPPSPATLSRIMDHKTTRARRACDGSLERPLIIVCNAIRQQLMNLR